MSAAVQSAERAAAREAFRQWRYGMFIHYGLYALLGRREWAMCYERIPLGEYQELAEKFRPAAGCAEAWVRLAKESGMRYACLTARHHDGFALFDTAASGFNSVRAPARRDLVQEYVEACRKHGLGVGLYYSVADWGDAGFSAGPAKNPGGWQRFVQIVHAQLRELMSRYGRIHYLFYDGCPPPATWGCAEINAEIRRLQPGILISDRCGLQEDVQSAENFTINDPGKVWECCLTMNESWGFNSGDLDWKTPRQVVKVLMTCAHNGGNLLLNIGPQADGSVPQPSLDILQAVRAWLERNQAAVFGTTPHPFNYADQKLSTARDNKAYVALNWYYGPDTVVGGIGNRVVAARTLADGRPIAFRQTDARLRLCGLPLNSPDPLFCVVEIELAGQPQGIPYPPMVAARYN